MKSDHHNSSQNKRIKIKRQIQKIAPIAKQDKQDFKNQDKTIHVRRHSVIVSNSRYGAAQRMSHQFVMENKYERCLSRDLAYPQSYQSSKQIKAITKVKIQHNHDSKQDFENQKTQKFSIGLLVGGLSPNNQFLSKSSYQYMTMIGKGGFGKVWRVRHKSSGYVFALKQMSKATVIAKRSVDSILNQRQLLSSLKHQFIVNMVYAFQDKSTLYLVMNIKEGGDLRYHLAKKHQFTETQTRFITGSIILALQYLHKKLIIHRDIKPENIVFDSQGYASLTDLGIAKYLRSENYTDTSGTPGYMAPQVMFHHNHRFEVDFYALGVIIYELMLGKRPYIGKTRQQIKQLVLAKQVMIKKDEIPENWSIQSADFVNKLLQRKPVQRLGWGGIQQLKNHKWLKFFPWKQVGNKQIDSPFKEKYNPQQVRYRITQFETQFQKLLNKNKQMLERGNLQQYFVGYTFEGNEAKSTSKSTFLR